MTIPLLSPRKLGISHLLGELESSEQSALAVVTIFFPPSYLRQYRCPHSGMKVINHHLIQVMITCVNGAPLEHVIRVWEIIPLQQRVPEVKSGNCIDDYSFVLPQTRHLDAVEGGGAVLPSTMPADSLSHYNHLTDSNGHVPKRRAVWARDCLLSGTF